MYFAAVCLKSTELHWNEQKRDMCLQFAIELLGLGDFNAKNKQGMPKHIFFNHLLSVMQLMGVK